MSSIFSHCNRCLHDPANVQQTSSFIITYGSKRPALRLLEVCWTFAGSCKHPITESSEPSGEGLTDISVYDVSRVKAQIEPYSEIWIVFDLFEAHMYSSGE